MQLASAQEASEVLMKTSGSQVKIIMGDNIYYEFLPENTLTEDDFMNNIVKPIKKFDFVTFNSTSSNPRWYNVARIDAIEFIANPELYNKDDGQRRQQ